MNRVEDQIEAKLGKLEEERGIRIVYACESGSRAWGFASPDSDYDVRFLYLHPEEHYLQVRTPKDSIDLPLDGDLDFGGWDVRKALGLFTKSNGALLEWLHSPIVYRQDEEVVAGWRDLIRDVVDTRALTAHYLGMARQASLKLQGDSPSTKKYLYSLRATLAAEHVLEVGTVPPVEFDRLVAGIADRSVGSREVVQSIRDLVAEKSTVEETATRDRHPVIDAFLEEQQESLNRELDGRSAREINFRRVDAFFRQLVKGEI